MTLICGDKGSHIVGYVYMLVSTTSFTGMALVSKMIGARASTEEKLFWRSLLSVLLTLMANTACLGKVQMPQRCWLLLLRGVCGHVALLAYLEAIEIMPLAEAVFLGKVHPIAASLLSWVFLGERLSWMRCLCILTSLIGVGLIANPSRQALLSGSLLGPALALGAGSLSGAAYCCVRSLGRSKEAEIWTLLSLPLVSLPFCVTHTWHGAQQTRESQVWVWLLFLGVCTQLGQVFLARGLAVLPTACGTQAMYFGTVSGLLAGVLLGEGFPNLQAAAGGVLILGSLQVAELFDSQFDAAVAAAQKESRHWKPE